MTLFFTTSGKILLSRNLAGILKHRVPVAMRLIDEAFEELLKKAQMRSVGPWNFKYSVWPGSPGNTSLFFLAIA